MPAIPGVKGAAPGLHFPNAPQPHLRLGGPGAVRVLQGASDVSQFTVILWVCYNRTYSKAEQ